MQFSLAQVETEDALWRGRDDKKAIGGGDECTPWEHPARYKKCEFWSLQQKKIKTWSKPNNWLAVPFSRESIRATTTRRTRSHGVVLPASRMSLLVRKSPPTGEIGLIHNAFCFFLPELANLFPPADFFKKRSTPPIFFCPPSPPALSPYWVTALFVCAIVTKRPPPPPPTRGGRRPTNGRNAALDERERGGQLS